MNKIIFVSFNNENQAYEGARAMREVRTNVLYAGAIIAQDPNGKIVVRQSLIERPAATLTGLLMGNLVGLLGPAAVAIDSGSGALLGAAIDAAKAGITPEFLQTIQKELAAGKTGILAEIDEEWESPIDIRVDPLGGTVFRQPLAQLEDAFFNKEIEAQEAELVRLEEEKEAEATKDEKQASTERNVRLQEKIDAKKQQILQKQNELVERIRTIGREGEKKIALLRDQMADADEDAQIQLGDRLKDIRTEYQLRAKELNQVLHQRKKPKVA